MTWGNSITRICSWVEFEDGFRFYNTHWDHESQWARAKSAELIVDILPITPWILVGDFNAEPASDELQVLAQAPDIVFISKDNLVGTFHNFQGCLDGERIDHLFTSAKLSANLTRVIMSHQGDLYPSDHYPVLFEVSL
jgi:endonuclease/exonuclease/phosphatase family metal-dependent hydrolase